MTGGASLDVAPSGGAEVDARSLFDRIIINVAVVIIVILCYCCHYIIITTVAIIATTLALSHSTG